MRDLSIKSAVNKILVGVIVVKVFSMMKKEEC
jgi:hypothetical protein